MKSMWWHQSIRFWDSNHLWYEITWLWEFFSRIVIDKIVNQLKQEHISTGISKISCSTYRPHSLRCYITLAQIQSELLHKKTMKKYNNEIWLTERCGLKKLNLKKTIKILLKENGRVHNTLVCANWMKEKNDFSENLNDLSANLFEIRLSDVRIYILYYKFFAIIIVQKNCPYYCKTVSYLLPCLLFLKLNYK